MAPRELQFGRLARYYDAFQSRKDYRAEARYLTALHRRYGRSGGAAWLDVACGTGRHLEHLRTAYSVEGLDESPDMLRIARHRLPGVPLRRADMRSFRLGRRFDVVSCLFSAMGHLRSERELARTFRRFAAHLKPGGVAFLEPWIDPRLYRPGFLHLLTVESEGAKLVRLAHSRKRGGRSLVQYEYLLGTSDRGIEHLSEVTVGLLVPRERLLDLLRAAGLRSRWISRGLTPGRGLIIATKPLGARRTLAA